MSDANLSILGIIAVVSIQRSITRIPKCLLYSIRLNLFVYCHFKFLFYKSLRLALVAAIFWIKYRWVVSRDFGFDWVWSWLRCKYFFYLHVAPSSGALLFDQAWMNGYPELMRDSILRATIRTGNRFTRQLKVFTEFISLRSITAKWLQHRTWWCQQYSCHLVLWTFSRSSGKSWSTRCAYFVKFPILRLLAVCWSMGTFLLFALGLSCRTGSD